MTIIDKNTLKSWFKRGLKPLEAQFSAWMDSYWHKSDQIPTSNIEGLEEALNNKTESADLDKKLDKKAGDSKECITAFDQATTRSNINSGETHSILFGKIKRWFSDMKAIAFTAKAEDLIQDENHRLVTDIQITGWDKKAEQGEQGLKGDPGIDGYTNIIESATEPTDKTKGSIWIKI